MWTGQWRTATDNGVPFTGWGWNDRDRYYFVNNAPVTGWQYIDGFGYYFDETGKLLTDLEPIVGNSGPFLISINKQMNCMTIFCCRTAPTASSSR